MPIIKVGGSGPAVNRLQTRVALTEGELGDARQAVNGGTYGLPEFETAYRRGERLFPAL